MKKAEIVVLPKYDFDPQILQFNTNETEQVCKSNIQEVQNLEMYHITEGDLADKENDNKYISLKAFIRKKGASKVEGNLEEGDSEIECKAKTSNRRNSKSKFKPQNLRTQKSPTFAVPKSSQRTMNKKRKLFN